MLTQTRVITGAFLCDNVCFLLRWIFQVLCVNMHTFCYRDQKQHLRTFPGRKLQSSIDTIIIYVFLEEKSLTYAAYICFT